MNLRVTVFRPWWLIDHRLFNIEVLEILFVRKGGLIEGFSYLMSKNTIILTRHILVAHIVKFSNKKF